MKKVLSLALVLVMALTVLAGCGSTSSAPESSLLHRWCRQQTQKQVR